MEENKLISEFMGLPKVPCNIGTEDGYFTEGYKHPNVAVPTIPSGMQYKYSWNWLMPVVEKCFKTGDDTHEWDNIMDTIFTCDIDIVYKQVLGFIKQYNDEQNKA